MECCLIFIRSLLTCFHLFILASLFLSCAVLRSVTESISSSFETDLSMSSNEIKQVNLLSKAKVLSTPTYSRSKERKNLQGFCLLQMFLSGTYSEVPNRRACSLRFFRFSFHPVHNFSCNKRKIPPCSFNDLLSKKADRVNFFSKPARLLGTSEC